MAENGSKVEKEGEAPRAPAYLATVRRLKAFIAAEGLRIGDSLPTERALAQKFGVSRHSLREALRVLQEQGILDPQQGSGNYIASQDIESLEDDLRAEDGLGDDVRNRDIFEFRALIEPEIAALAAARATPRDLNLLQGIIAQQANTDDPRTLRLLDDAFHLGLARSARNHVLEPVIRSINAVVGHVRSEVYQGPQRNRLSLDGHKQIVAALAATDPHAARRAMQRHIARIRGFVMEDDG